MALQAILLPWGAVLWPWGTVMWPCWSVAVARTQQWSRTAAWWSQMERQGPNGTLADGAPGGPNGAPAEPNGAPGGPNGAPAEPNGAPGGPNGAPVEPNRALGGPNGAPAEPNGALQIELGQKIDFPETAIIDGVLFKNQGSGEVVWPWGAVL